MGNRDISATPACPSDACLIADVGQAAAATLREVDICAQQRGNIILMENTRGPSRISGRTEDRVMKTPARVRRAFDATNNTAPPTQWHCMDHDPWML